MSNKLEALVKHILLRKRHKHYEVSGACCISGVLGNLVNLRMLGYHLQLKAYIIASHTG